jgi:hypothetical protein
LSPNDSDSTRELRAKIDLTTVMALIALAISGLSGTAVAAARIDLASCRYRRLKITSPTTTIAAMIHVVALRLPSHALIEYVSC